MAIEQSPLFEESTSPLAETVAANANTSKAAASENAANNPEANLPNERAGAVDIGSNTVPAFYIGVNRNKRLSDEIDVLGDIHLAKQFKTGVPLDRRGEREASVWADFEASLMATKAKYHVQMGDLFDAFVVPNAVVLRAAEIYIRAAGERPDTMFVTYCGNHDRSRNVGVNSSFDVFKEIVGSYGPNIRALTDVMSTIDGLAFIPWHPFTPAADLASKILADGKYTHVFGHWDCKSFKDLGRDDHNLIPLEQLAGKTKSVVTGHEHNAREYDHGDIHVTVVGSMQPFSHAEDESQEFYVTLTPDDYAAFREFPEQFESLANKHVRFLLKEGETVPDGVEALSVSAKTVAEDGEDVKIDVDLGQFDMKELLDISLGEAGVNEVYSVKMHEQFGVMRAAE